MRYKVVLLLQSEEGFSISCPDLPEFWSQRRTNLMRRP